MDGVTVCVGPATRLTSSGGKESTRGVANGSMASVLLPTVPDSRSHVLRTGHLDPESRDWVERLAPQSPGRDAAIEALHALLLRAARFEIARRRAAVAHLRGNDLDDLAHQSADDALVAILSKLGEFRGDSRFTTWAFKFALLEAAVKLRRRAWQGREVPLEPERWALFAAPGSTPEQDAESAERLRAVRDAIELELTPHQHRILVAVALDGVPIDVLAERLDTTRGALYKTIHDARRKLRAALAAGGHDIDGETGTVAS
jgi:RNA polymerase sigma-70 factor, ECF subfamily